ncbi:MAG: hypothetical protein U0166_25310 [Acidobacteriota bacterium]
MPKVLPADAGLLLRERDPVHPSKGASRAFVDIVDATATRAFGHLEASTS